MVRAIRNRYPEEVAKYYPDSAGPSQIRTLVEPTTSDRAHNQRLEPGAIQSAERRDVAVGTKTEVDDFCVRKMPRGVLVTRVFDAQSQLHRSDQVR